ncbi:MAG TPA: 3-hydroxyacyl-CoA dehydrogenase family protein, partial [Chitinophagaceae bacterium]|nr:3-hydroxyacyl-CoA dehydrogenase family protein [Chitinophagaceae bacterium]
EPSIERIALLQKQSSPVIINSVIETLADIDPSFTRINAWPGFLGTIAEGSCRAENSKEKVRSIFEGFNKKIEWVPDEPGFITPRVICMIINEAYFALEEKVSSKEEIDIAMKLGTAYPYGPFEWSKKIGLLNVYNLLHRLGGEEKRYEPAGLLKQEALGVKYGSC